MIPPELLPICVLAFFVGCAIGIIVYISAKAKRSLYKTLSEVYLLEAVLFLIVSVIYGRWEIGAVGVIAYGFGSSAIIFILLLIFDRNTTITI